MEVNQNIKVSSNLCKINEIETLIILPEETNFHPILTVSFVLF